MMPITEQLVAELNKWVPPPDWEIPKSRPAHLREATAAIDQVLAAPVLVWTVERRDEILSRVWRARVFRWVWTYEKPVRPVYDFKPHYTLRHV